MMDALSKAVTLYVAPVLSLTAILLCLFAFLSPVIMLRTQVSLFLVKPSLALLPNKSGSVDGPTVFFGALGSCSRANNSSPVICTYPSLIPTYNLSVLPSNSPNSLLTPITTTPVFIAISLALSIMFFLLFTMIAFREKLGTKISGIMEKPLLQRVVVWIGLLGFMIGITSFLVIRMWFGKAVEDFNYVIALQGSQAPALIAEASNGFIMVLVGYAFLTVPLVCALSKIHLISASTGKV